MTCTLHDTRAHIIVLIVTQERIRTSACLTSPSHYLTGFECFTSTILNINCRAESIRSVHCRKNAVSEPLTIFAIDKLQKIVKIWPPRIARKTQFCTVAFYYSWNFMVPMISAASDLPHFTPSNTFINLPEFYLLCWLGGVAPLLSHHLLPCISPLAINVDKPKLNKSYLQH